ncbi:hypothetical protein LEMLEM_LOCUS2125 [Lemmus lemmus]
MRTFGDGEAAEQCLKGCGEAVGNFGTNTRKLHEFSDSFLEKILLCRKREIARTRFPRTGDSERKGPREVGDPVAVATPRRTPRAAPSSLLPRPCKIGGSGLANRFLNQRRLSGPGDHTEAPGEAPEGAGCTGPAASGARGLGRETRISEGSLGSERARSLRNVHGGGRSGRRGGAPGDPRPRGVRDEARSRREAKRETPPLARMRRVRLLSPPPPRRAGPPAGGARRAGAGPGGGRRRPWRREAGGGGGGS